MILRFKKYALLLILLGIFFASTTKALEPGVHDPDPKEPPRAMWVWDVKIFQDEEASARLFNFCKARNINTLFYTAYKVTGSNIEKDYRRFNKEAHKRGISIQALAGDPRWAVEKYHQRFLEWAGNILEFNKIAAVDEKFDGMHADVEPYLIGGMWEQNSAGILVQFLDASKKVKALIDNSGSKIIFAADVPFWYDDDAAMWVDWQDKVSPANYHLLDILDEIAIMDYRNFAEGDNGSILLAKNEVDYASKAGKKVYIGQETGKDLKPEYITFGGTNADYMEAEIKKLVTAYIDNPGFKGIAIHHYISYKRLLRESGKAVE